MVFPASFKPLFMKVLCLSLILVILLPLLAFNQNIQKVVFDSQDTTGGYYLAVPPLSNNIKGTLVLCTSFASPESMLPETSLHNVAYANDLLTIFVSLKEKLYADSQTVSRLNVILNHVEATYKADTSKFILAGYDFAGGPVLRYTELAKENPQQVPLQPKGAIAIGSPVDLFSLWKWCERQVKRNAVSAWDARYIMDLMTREHGSVVRECSAQGRTAVFIEVSPQHRIHSVWTTLNRIHNSFECMR